MGTATDFYLVCGGTPQPVYLTVHFVMSQALMCTCICCNTGQVRTKSHTEFRDDDTGEHGHETSHVMHLKSWHATCFNNMRNTMAGTSMVQLVPCKTIHQSCISHACIYSHVHGPHECAIHLALISLKLPLFHTSRNGNGRGRGHYCGSCWWCRCMQAAHASLVIAWALYACITQ